MKQRLISSILTFMVLTLVWTYTLCQEVPKVPKFRQLAYVSGTGTVIPQTVITSQIVYNSPSQDYRLVFQGDGNIVIYDCKTVTWASGPNNPSKTFTFYLDSNGKIRVYDNAGPLWWTNGITGSATGAFAVIQNDGNFVTYDGSGNPIWTTNSGGSLAASTCTTGNYLNSGKTSCCSCPTTIANCVTCTSSSTCTACVAGYYVALGGSSCQACPEGQWSSAGVSCTNCPAGTNSSTVGATSSSTCVSCPAGKYSATGASSCTACSAGSYSSAGVSSCISCPAGKYSLTVGATSSSTCLSCPAGSYSSVAGASLCGTCSAGQWASAGATSCTSCVAGTYSSTMGATSSSTCVPCPSGQYSSAGASSCSSSCPAGSFLSPGDTVCTMCPAGTYSATTGAISSLTCLSCPSGQYSSEGAASCTACPPNQCSNAGAEFCHPCATTCYTNISQSKTAYGSVIAFSVISKLGSSMGTASSVFVNFGLMSRIIQNIIYLNISGSPELQKAFLTWKASLPTWNAPKAWSSLPGSRPLPLVFSQYCLDSRFLVNFWEDLMIIAIGLGTFVLFKVIKLLVRRQNKDTGFLPFLTPLINTSSNFIIAQSYVSLVDIVFFTALNFRSVSFEFIFSSLSFGLSVLCLLLVVGMFSAHFYWVIRKYPKLKRQQVMINSLNTSNANAQKFEPLTILYRNFKDTSFLQRSFFAWLVIRALLSALITVTLFHYPLIQAVLLTVLSPIIILLLIIKAPFTKKSYMVAQYFSELMNFTIAICMLTMAIADSSHREATQVRKGIGKCIIIFGAIFLYGSLVFMSFELFKNVKTLIKAWKKRKSRAQVFNIQSTPQPIQENDQTLMTQNTVFPFNLSSSIRISDMSLVSPIQPDTVHHSFPDTVTFETTKKRRKLLIFHNSQVLPKGNVNEVTNKEH